MKGLSLLLWLAAGACAQTTGVHNIYILPMAGGLDQYLAAQLAHDHTLRVVADPKTADAVLTDRIGEAFERKMATIHPRDEDNDKAGETHPSFQSSKARGTMFLVDAKSRQVLWSDYEKPLRAATADALNREAERIVKKLASPAKEGRQGS